MKLEIKGLSKSFDKKTVLTDLSATFEQGKIYGVLGRNGSGKTTLFQCINGDLIYESGSITLNDQPLSIYDIGLVYSDINLPEFLTGYEYLSFFIDMNPDKDLSRQNIDQYFDSIQFKMEDAHRLIKDYSFGMKNKLQMLTVVLSEPKILLLDEPLTSFDLVASHEIKQMLLSLKSNCIMLLSTHILQIAQDMCDEIAVLHHGSLDMIDGEEMHSQSFENKLMEILRDDI